MRRFVQTTARQRSFVKVLRDDHGSRLVPVVRFDRGA
jgi:hypothetical protein